MTFTPGPWRLSETWRPPISDLGKAFKNSEGNIFWGYSISGSDENGAHILPTLAAVHNFSDQMEANARLIASAPDLLAALEGLAEVCSCQNGCDPDDMTCATNVARAAITKALEG